MAERNIVAKTTMPAKKNGITQPDVTRCASLKTMAAMASPIIKTAIGFAPVASPERSGIGGPTSEIM